MEYVCAGTRNTSSDSCCLLLASGWFCCFCDSTSTALRSQGSSLHTLRNGGLAALGGAGGRRGRLLALSVAWPNGASWLAGWFFRLLSGPSFPSLGNSASDSSSGVSSFVWLTYYSSINLELSLYMFLNCYLGVVRRVIRILRRGREPCFPLKCLCVGFTIILKLSLSRCLLLTIYL